MSVRIDPTTLAAMADKMTRSTDDLANAQPLPPADAGPSSSAVSATVADLLRAIAGYAETAHRGAADLHASWAHYASTDESNRRLLKQVGRPGP